MLIENGHDQALAPRGIAYGADVPRGRRVGCGRYGMPQEIRLPAVAGLFYPASAAALDSTLRQLLDAAPDRTLPNLRALIVPHAGYRYSGPVAAVAFKLLHTTPASYGTVLLLGPAHRVWVNGVAVGGFDAMETPLGIVPVDRRATAWLLSRGQPFLRHYAAHQPEHCLEVELPFLQCTVPGVHVVPLLFGDTEPALVAGHLLDLLRSRTDDLVIVSSDLSHYHPYDEAVRRDRSLLQALLAGDRSAVARGQACGLLPILTLMTLAHELGWQPHLLDYRNSGDTGGGRDAVVGYAAVAFTAPAVQ